MRCQPRPMSAPRRFVNDLLHFAHRIPTVPVQRHCNLAPLADARRACTPRPSWTALFTLAYSRVAARTPELRRFYTGFPWPRIHEAPHSLAAIAVEREYHGERAVFIGRIKYPEQRSLADIHQAIQSFQTDPVLQVQPFRDMLRIAALPRPLRRLLWRLVLAAPRLRSNYLGTFGVTVYSALGAESLHPISPCTTTLTYGVIAADGRVPVRIIYDHRVMDGATVARALAALEEELNGSIVREVAKLATASRQAA